MRAETDVVVVGAGHAGCEAALAAARLGARTLLLTRDPAAVARMSCNPAIGGIAKGNVVCELDALGGGMPVVADRTGIQFKVLNGSRGPAVQGPRCQSDKEAYSSEMAAVLAGTPGLDLRSATVTGILVEGHRVRGVRLEDGSEIRAAALVLTSGTFLGGLIHVGEKTSEAGRWGEPAAIALSGSLRALGLRLGRMKTGTPPRVHRDSVDAGRMRVALGDEVPRPFSARTRKERFPAMPQAPCWLTHTTGRTHELIRDNLSSSPLYTGRITGRGPRYCPSVEDKVVRFPEKERHQIFVEPEGLSSEWLYLNGLSMSLPLGIQETVVRSIPGLDRAVVVRPAYAVEYDMVFPEQLDDTLAVRGVPGLFLAGQINGTSGYEEAAGQGLVAGVNAADLALGGPRGPFTLGREEAYIGVMVDDLVTQGADEPYRLLTSRAEYRLLLGAATVYSRLTPRAIERGLVDERTAEGLLRREERLGAVREKLEATPVRPDRATLEELGSRGVSLSEASTLAGLLRRPDLDAGALRPWIEERLARADGGSVQDPLDLDAWERLVDEVRYAGFLRRERETAARLARSGGIRIPERLDYAEVPGLSLEAREKLERHRPRTVGQAGRIPGVTPAATALVLARVVADSRRKR